MAGVPLSTILPRLDTIGQRDASKGESRKRIKGRKDRAEANVKQAVRAACVERDGYCVIRRSERLGDVSYDMFAVFDCHGPSQWCHMHSRRRSQTRNQAPELRHDTQHSFMACQRHHDQYDGRQKPRLFVTALTRQGADGPLKFRRGRP